MAPTKPTFTTGERLAFRYRFTNVGDKDLVFYNMLFDYLYADTQQFDGATEIVITELGTSKAYRVSGIPEIQITRERLRKKSVAVLSPGKSLDAIYEYRHGLFNPQGTRDFLALLPPGRYQMRMTWKFSPVADWPATAPWWFLTVP
jgi:hypothetical protein